MKFSYVSTYLAVVTALALVTACDNNGSPDAGTDAGGGTDSGAMDSGGGGDDGGAADPCVTRTAAVFVACGQESANATDFAESFFCPMSTSLSDVDCLESTECDALLAGIQACLSDPSVPCPCLGGEAPDGGTSDGGTSDAGTSDGGTSDGGTSDAGTSDGGSTGDAGPDAGTSGD